MEVSGCPDTSCKLETDDINYYCLQVSLSKMSLSVLTIYQSVGKNKKLLKVAYFAANTFCSEHLKPINPASAPDCDETVEPLGQQEAFPF